METYKTAQLAAILGIHPNTVRLYEQLHFITAPERLPNGYRVFTELHLYEMRFARAAMRAEVLQNGLRKKATEAVLLTAKLELSAAEQCTLEYKAMVECELERARAAISAVNRILAAGTKGGGELLTRRQAASALGITVDSLRNWELNGLFAVKRLSNGYRVYDGSDMEQLAIIRTLRCANYSLTAILRLMNRLNRLNGQNGLSNAQERSELELTRILNDLPPDEEIVSVCDRLLVTLSGALNDAREMSELLEKIKTLHLATNL